MRTAEEILQALSVYGPTPTLEVLAEESPAFSTPTRALWIYTQVALAIGPDPRFADEACVALLVQCVLAVDGEWTDVEQLIRQDEPLLAVFLDEYDARLAWQVHGGAFPVFAERAVAA